MLIGLVVLLLIGVFGTLVVAQQLTSSDALPEPTPATITTDPATDVITTPAPDPTTVEPVPDVTGVGLVTISTPSPDAERVATMFDAYFTAINAEDYDTVLSLYDPNGVLDTTDAAKSRRFIKEISTSRDDQVILGDVADNGDSLTADLEFRSRQAAGMGPRADPEQTCTLWSLTYTLTDSAEGLLINRSEGTYDSC
jgi:hypothetical protein